MAAGGDVYARMLRDEGQPPDPRSIQPPSSDNPDLDAWFMEAYGHLCTERDFGMGLGPIPWSSMVAYADRAGLTRAAAGQFVTVMTALDRAELAEERAKQASKEADRGQ